MLKGSQPSMPISGSLPHTPSEQIDPSIPQHEPGTPQPHHPREPSFPQMPHFAYSPQRLQEQRRNHSVPDQAFHQHPQHQQQQDISHLPLHAQQMMFPLQQRQESMPNYFPRKAQRTPQFEPMQPAMRQQQSQYNRGFGPSVGDVRDHNWANQSIEAEDRSMRLRRPHLASPMHSFAGQRPLSSGKPIGSDPSMPEASKLPQPNLPAHTQNLLDAFKNGRKPQSGRISGPGSNQQRHSSQQASALLDLFRKHGEQSSPKPVADDAPAAPASPAVSDATVKPRNSKKKATVNEITRTLPARTKSKSSQHVAPSAGGDSQVDQFVEVDSPKEASMLASLPYDVAVERPKSRGKLHDPAKPKHFVRASSQTRKQDIPKASPKMKTKHKFPSPVQPAHPPQTTQSTPQFSILQRPSSSRSAVPQSPLRNESAGINIHPQVLRRPGDELTAELAAEEISTPPPSESKKNHLLSLFNKAPSAAAPASISSTSAQAGVSPPAQPHSSTSKKDQLLGLFNTKATSSVTPVKTPEPPLTPQLQPDVKVAQSQQGHRANGGQQQLLLSMFNKPGSSGSTQSPGTPNSPFTLGTPLSKEPPTKLTAPEPRSRLGSMQSITSNGTTSGQQTPGSATPTEASKGILLSYLNGVVEKEGYRGAKK
ncbi:hypothetical protein DOTSEDRAFT_85704 [Dothistroma septosporum NZE10]|uniref:Uncharacterized protein n=1 Tax=Dothistroma septosporum (strain NZE10 / CBS 128990) TaxID=675120 RepID=N1PUK5_DOTSN|nr:hypothetical protein DOTSEDRAFT_85704 [Dothistroma septosporum NZE10]